MLVRAGCALAAAAALTGCGDNHDHAADAAGTPDATAADAAVADAAGADAAPADAAPADASAPDATLCANVVAGLDGDCMSTPVAATTPSLETPNAEIAWTGSELAIAWVDRDTAGTRRIYLTRIDPAGTALGTTQMSEGTGDVYNPAIAWTGSELGLTWTTNGNDVYFVRATAAGDRIGTPVQISEASASAQGVEIAWAGDRYGLTWHDARDGNSDIYFAALDASGTKLTADVRVTTSAARSWMPTLAWTGAAFAIAYREDASTFSGRVRLARVDATGAALGDAPISDASAWIGDPTVAWNGTQLVVAWDDNRATDRDLYVQYLDGAGVEQGADVRVTMTTTYTDEAHLAWNGTAYRVVWQEDLDVGPFALDAADLDAAGTKLTADVELAQSGLSPSSPRVLWLGDRYALFWQIAVDASTRQLMFATLTPM